MTSPSAKDPLKDTKNLVEAASMQAKKLLKEYTKGKGGVMTAMGFCRLVLDEGFGLQDWGVGQRQRIVISNARKEILGKNDANIIKRPPKASPLQLPSTSEIYKELAEENVAKTAMKKTSIDSKLDPDALKMNGILLVPTVFPYENVINVLEYLSKFEDNKKLKWTFLRPSTGNGQQGAYVTLPANVPESLRNLQDELRQALKNKLGVESGEKTLFLKYGVGGVNWAHQDQSTFPYQAMLLLSRPEVDFQGGKLYVADPSTTGKSANEKVCNRVDFQSSGDLVIFAANNSKPTSRPFYHGMTKVIPGQNKNEKDSHRLAIGLLQT